MNERPPFDPVRASFWLIAGIIAVYCFVVLAGTLSCLWYAHEIITDTRIECDPKNRLAELLSAALAAALAFVGGLTRKDK